MSATYEDVTEPMMLDSTGQEIKGVLQQIKGVIQPTNVCVDLDVSLDVNGWSNSAPYVYNWMNNKVTSECAVKVNFLEDSEDTDQLYIAYEKIVGGIQFEAPTKPTEAIPVRIHIVNAQADSITSISDDMVSSSVVAGTANVQEALEALNGQITSNSLGFIANESELSSALDTLLSSMGDNSRQDILFYISATTNFNASWYHATVKKYYDHYGSMLAESFTNDRDVVTGNAVGNSGWGFEKLALNSKIATQDFLALVTQDEAWQWLACSKVGNVCYITGRLGYVEIGTSDTKVLTLPSGYRPAYNACSPTVALDGSGSIPSTYGVCQIKSNGEMLIRNSANGYYNYVNTSYIV